MEKSLQVGYMEKRHLSLKREGYDCSTINTTSPCDSVGMDSHNMVYSGFF